MTATAAPNGRCDPQGAGCKALSEVKSALREERGKHLAPIYNKLDGKAEESDVKDILQKMDSLKTLMVSMLVSMVLFLLATVGNLLIKIMAG